MPHGDAEPSGTAVIPPVQAASAGSVVLAASPSVADPPTTGPHPHKPDEADPEVRRAMRWAIFANTGNMVSAQFFNGPMLVVYSQALGLAAAAVGQLQFLVKVAALVRLPMARRVAIVGKRRILLREWGLAVPLCLPVVFAPQLAEWTGFSAGAAVMAGALAYNVLSQGGATGWLPLLQDIVPANVRGRFVALMRMSWQVVSALAVAGAAFWLGSHPAVADYQWVFAVAWTGVVIRWVGLFPIRAGAPEPAAVVPPMREMLLRPWQDRTFRVFLLVNLLHSAGWGILEPFRLVYLSRLGFDATYLTWGINAAALGAAASLWPWGKLADRFGARPLYGSCSILLAGCSLATAALPAVPDEWGMGAVLVLFFVSGAVFSGFGIAQTHSQMALVPAGPHQAIYFSTHMVSMLVTHGAAAFAAGMWLGGFDPAPVAAGAGSLPPVVLWGMDAYQAVFALVVAPLLLSPAFLRRHISPGVQAGWGTVMRAAWRKMR